MREFSTDSELAQVLRTAKTIAVLGAHADPSRPAFYVPDYLTRQGYRIIPVNPTLVGKTLFGEPVRATLAEIGEPVDIVDVFRRPDQLMTHKDDLLAMNPRPKVVWLQLGIRSEEFAALVLGNGMDLVQDHCTLAEHKRLGIGRVAS